MLSNYSKFSVVNVRASEAVARPFGRRVDDGGAPSDALIARGIVSRAARSPKSF